MSLVAAQGHSPFLDYLMKFTPLVTPHWLVLPKSVLCLSGPFLFFSSSFSLAPLCHSLLFSCDIGASVWRETIFLLQSPTIKDWFSPGSKGWQSLWLGNGGRHSFGGKCGGNTPLKVDLLLCNIRRGKSVIVMESRWVLAFGSHGELLGKG